jgi:hypothetical protein
LTIESDEMPWTFSPLAAQASLPVEAVWGHLGEPPPKIFLLERIPALKYDAKTDSAVGDPEAKRVHPTVRATRSPSAGGWERLFSVIV